jgi:GNAT superfamily N-acetyltransferase
MRRLWRRGEAGDARAIALMFEHHPEAARPELFRGPADTWLWPWLGAADADAAAALLDEQYWTRGVSRADLRRAQLGATAWVGAVRHGYVCDVAVAPAYRRRGVGKALVKLLLDHARLRHVAAVRLATSDAAAFYAPFGFEPEDDAACGVPVTRLLLRRS